MPIIAKKTTRKPTVPQPSLEQRERGTKMPKRLNEAQGIGQRVILWNRATSDGFVPALCVICKRVKTIKRSTALVWRSNKDAPACCARTGPHLVERIRELEMLPAFVLRLLRAGEFDAAETALSAFVEPS